MPIATLKLSSPLIPFAMGPALSSTSMGGLVILTTPVAVWMGDSQTAATGTNSIADFTDYFTNGQLKHVVGYNQGISGNMTTDMIAREATAFALNPELYFILAGTNDIVIGGRSAATIIANLTTMINHAKAQASIKLICIRTILKRSGANALTPPQEQVRLDVNTWIMAISDPKVLSVNYDASAFDPTIHTSDGLHPNQIGAVLLGRYTAAAIRPRLNIQNVLSDKTGNILTNGALAGTTGGKTSLTGEVATSWQMRNFMTGVTGVAAKEVINGITCQTVVLNGTNATNSFIDFTQSGTFSGLTGQTYEALSYMKVENGSTLGAIRMTGQGIVNFGGNSVASPLNQDMEGVMRSGMSTLSADTTAFTFVHACQFPAGAVLTNTKIIISDPIWRRIS